MRTQLVVRRARRILIASAIVALLAPVVVLVLDSASVSWFFPAPLPRRLSMAPWRTALADGSVRDAIVTGLLVSGVVALLAVLLSWPAARVLARPGLRGRGLIIGLLFLPSLLPGVGLAMGVDEVLLRAHLAGDVMGVVIAHLVPTIPYAVAALTAVFARHDPRIEAQAADLGATPWQRFRLVTFPLLRTGVAVAAALAFVVSWSQYLLTVLAGSGRVVTITMLLFAGLSGSNPSAIGVLAMIAAFPAMLLVVAAGRQTVGSRS